MSEFITPDLRTGAAVSPLRLASLALPARPLTDLPPRPEVDVDTLAGVPLLRHLEPALARQLAAHAAVRRLNRQAMVLEQGSRETALFALLQGQAQVVRRNPQGGLDLFPNQSSAVLTSTVWGDGLVDTPAATPIRRGDLVCFLAFTDLLS